MFSNITAEDMRWMCKILFWDYADTALSTKEHYVFHLNNAINKIYAKKQWTWNLLEFESNATAKSFTLPYSMLELVYIYVNDWESFERVQFITPDLEWWNFYQIISNSIIFAKEISYIKLVYRKKPNRYTVDSLSNELDIPSDLNEALYNYICAKMIPVYLWEWVWSLITLYKSFFDDNINEQMKIDWYAEVISWIKPGIWLR